MPLSCQTALKQVVGVLLLRSDGAALLQLRDDKPTIEDPGLWVLPGGHAESGETPEEGALREFEEEACYRCAELRPLIKFRGPEVGYDDGRELIFFWDWYDGLQQWECREGVALRFTSRAEVENLPRRDYLTRVWDLGLAESSRLRLQIKTTDAT